METRDFIILGLTCFIVFQMFIIAVLIDVAKDLTEKLLGDSKNEQTDERYIRQDRKGR